jgi:nucleoside-diphosphate-sugar epimerase
MHTVDTTNPSLNLVVIGAAGRLGSALVGSYSKHHRVTGLTRSELNLADPDSIRRALEPLDFDRLILPGALTAVDYCEDHEDEAFAVNADGPKLIAQICAEKGAHVTYISTDFVFDGISERAYCETAIACPLSVYGASKLEGEEGVLAVSEHNLVNLRFQNGSWVRRLSKNSSRSRRRSWEARHPPKMWSIFSGSSSDLKVECQPAECFIFPTRGIAAGRNGDNFVWIRPQRRGCRSRQRRWVPTTWRTSLPL